MSETTDRYEFDSQAQAYVDNELAHEEREAFRRRMRSEADLRAQVERLAAMKQCLRDAYPPVGASARLTRVERPGWMATAAALLLGVVLGFFASHFTPGSTPNSTFGDLAAAESAADDMTRVLLHIGSEDPDAMAEALVSARYILNDFSESGRAVRVHMVANGPGLAMFRSGVSPFAAQIGDLERAFPNVQFVACQNTIDRLEKKTKEPVTLLPEVLRVDSGVADIARKRASGWLYIGV